VLQPRQTEKPAVGIIFDTGLSRVDDALTMALLYGLDGKKEERVVSQSVSRANLKAAIYSDVVGRFYAGAVSGAIGFGGRTLPVGLADNGPLKDDLPLFTQPLARTLVDGKPAYPSDIKDSLDTAEIPAMIRNALTAQWDGNTIVIVSGPATNLAHTLATGNSKDWIQRKVQLLVFTGGRFPNGPAEDNVKADIESARKLFADWPTPIVVCGAEMDGVMSYPASSIEKDFAWSPAHPVVDAYKAAGTMPYDAPIWAMHASLYAVRPKEGYFKISDPGTVTVQADGRTTFSPSANGRHRYLIYDPAQKERLLKTYTEIASAKPVERPQRLFQKPQNQQKQPDPQKPGELKQLDQKK
jgi:inosine-uridine nucleoside N-ribohydrolase